MITVVECRAKIVTGRRYMLIIFSSKLIKGGEFLFLMFYPLDILKPKTKNINRFCWCE